MSEEAARAERTQFSTEPSQPAGGGLRVILP